MIQEEVTPEQEPEDKATIIDKSEKSTTGRRKRQSTKLQTPPKAPVDGSFTPPPADEAPAVSEAPTTERPNAVRWLSANKASDETVVGDVARFLGENLDDFPKSSAVRDIRYAMSERGASEATIAGVSEAVASFNSDRQENAGK